MERRTAAALTWSFALSAAAMIALLGALIVYAPAWYFLANTRVLDLLIDSGFIRYHDRNSGFVDGVGDLRFYLMSQDPVAWHIVVVVLVVFLTSFVLRGLQFHGLMRHVGLEERASTSLRVFASAHLARRVLPWSLGDVALATLLRERGASEAAAWEVARARRVFVALELLVFSAVALAYVGWSTWLGMMFWAVVVAGAAWFLVRPGNPADWLAAARGVLASLTDAPRRALGLLLLSLLAFALEDLAAYLITMAFTAEHVFLAVPPSSLLMALAAGTIARQVAFTPGGIGQFEVAFAASLRVSGVAFHECVTIAILYSVLRYGASGLFYAATLWRRDVDTSVAKGLVEFTSGWSFPDAQALWGRGLVVLGAVSAVFFLDQLTYVLFDYWLLDSLGLASVFWTNFGVGATLFVVGLAAVALAVALPAFRNPLGRGQRAFVVGAGLLAGAFVGRLLARNYEEFLVLGGVPFGETDPVFGYDVAFYAFTLPALWLAWRAALAAAVLGLISAIGCGYVGAMSREVPASTELNGLGRVVAALATPVTLVTVAAAGLVLAVGEWLGRYQLLYADNSASAVYVGAEYVDAHGLLSTLNYIYVTAVVILALTATAVWALRALHRSGRSGDQRWRRVLQQAFTLALALIAFDFLFRAAVSVRDWVAVIPNEPVIQLESIGAHIQATRRAWQLDDVEEVPFVPAMPGDPVPDVDALLATPTMRNVPMWPGFTSYLEVLLDPQHAARIVQTGGDKTIYGPTLEIFRQEQKLRTYYDFLGVDSARYVIDGEKRHVVTAVRELPLIEPYPWLGWFGQRFMLYTHGWGLVIGMVSGSPGEGAPDFVSHSIPTITRYPELAVDEPRVYYGEGSSTIAYSNVRGLRELDRPTDQSREEILLSEQDAHGVGVKIDSLLKRFVFGWRSGQLFEVVFSGLITDETVVHFFRTPIERLEHVAPFLYLDPNPYAVAADGRIVWLVNGMTTSDRYPYSKFEDLGDKSNEMSRFPRPNRRVNYVEDSVKATVDATTGAIRLYRISDDPVVATWAQVYPELFTAEEDMPASIRSHLTYPTHLMHAQFDNLYIYYHMEDPIYFFNQEDLWDDADEVLGPIMDNGQAITFSIEPYNFLLQTGVGGIPAAADPIQYSLAMVFTNEKAPNLRAIPIALQDGEDYGRTFVLELPKGTFYPSPEQADAAIDQEPEISGQIAWWNRRGTDVIRGQTTTLVIGREILYVEPIFLRSQQAPVTQLKRVSVVFRGVPRIGRTVEEALRKAVAAYEVAHGLPTDATLVHVPEGGEEPGEEP